MGFTRSVEDKKIILHVLQVEEKGESIHAELNAIQRRIWCIRDPAERLWKYIERYELKNVLNTDIVVPEKQNFKNKGQ